MLKKRHFILAAVFATRLVCAVPAPSQLMPDRFDLQQAIAFSLEHNFAIRQARARIRQQQGVVTTVGAVRLPNVSVTSSYQKSDALTVLSAPGQPFIFAPAGRFWRINLTATQTVFAGGGVRASIQSANLAREAAVLEFQAVVNQALLDVRTRFYDVLLAREQIKVQEQNLELLQAQLKYASIRAQAGTASEFERLRAEVAVANAEVPLIRARNDFRLAVEELRRVTGFTTNEPASADKIPELLGSLAFEPVTIDMEAAFQAAQANRPDLKRLSKLAAARKEDVDAARSRYYPNLSLTGGGELRKGSTNSFGESVKGLRAGARASIEITRATSGQVIQANSQVEQAHLAENEARLAAEVEVRTAVFAIERASELALAMAQTVGQAEEAVRLATVRFEAGAATQLDVLQAQVELTNARTSQLRACYGHNVAVAQLKKATGVAEVEYRETGADDKTLGVAPVSKK